MLSQPESRVMSRFAKAAERSALVERPQC